MSNAARPRRAYKRALVAAVATAAVAVPVVSSQAAAASPNFYSTSSSHHVTVQSAWPSARNYDQRNTPLNRLLTGYNPGVPGTQPASVSRSYVQLTTAPLAGKQILSARLDAKVAHSWTCASGSPTELWQAGTISPSTSWAAQPGLIRYVGSTARNNNPNCPNDGSVSFDVTSLVRDAAQNNWADVTLGLKAQNENDQTAVRNFALDPVLVVEYNSAPNTPSNLSTDDKGCGGDTYVPTTTPQLRAQVSDPDGGVVETVFQVFDTAGQPLWQGSVYAQSGTFASVQAQGIPAEGKYSWSAQARDGIVASSWTSPCAFTVGAPDPSETTSTPPPPPAG